MPDTFVQNAPSLDEARKLYRRASKVIKKAQKARKATKAAAAKKRPVAPAKKPAPIAPKKAWLGKPVKVRKITAPPPVTTKLGYRPPATRVSVPALKGVSVRPVAGEWNGVDLIPVISSNVAARGYSPERALLVVQFTDGSIYEYTDVPEDVWHRFSTAPSQGRFVWRELRDVFAYQRVK
jgi:hypothetical protein